MNLKASRRSVAKRTFLILLGLAALSHERLDASSFASFASLYEGATESLSEDFLKFPATWKGRCSYVAGPLTTHALLDFHQQGLIDGGVRYFAELKNITAEPKRATVRKDRDKFSERFALSTQVEPMKVDGWLSLRPVGETPNVGYIRLGPNDADGSVVGRYYQVSQAFKTLPARLPYVWHRHWLASQRGSFRLVRDFNYHLRFEETREGKSRILMKLVCNTSDCNVGKGNLKVAAGEPIAYCVFDKKL